ncbi:hypothetical protein BHU72_01345 [Desulfuribacillus stibiiarsenatis]|uniref:Rhodanese domain-containing protein n=1 Tax=Desulfuribacillus stibiiarsenatis TaxID=1390249 RepID=A0A1E5LAB0_9FIRM|nr:rhodanese-like domain-containing protein [Desulfuribacillus stibiiarsenatis]OEH86933.1 hypothetical protein BHU72_01345 [Desulfuribacillus stibiiarsenatis]
MNWNISPKDFARVCKKRDRDSYIVLDVREEDEFLRYSIPNSLWIPLSEVVKRSSELPNHKDIYIVCEHGIRSVHATLLLYDLGFTNVFNVMGGFEKLAKYELLTA